MSSIFMKCSRIRIDLVLRRRGNADFAGASCSTAKSSALPHSLAGSLSGVESWTFSIPIRLRETFSVIREQRFYTNIKKG